MSVEKKLSKLHELLADELTNRIVNGETTDDGVVVPAKASTLNVIRQFLKDNNVDAIPAEGSALSGLIDSLPEDFKTSFNSRH